ncbi:tyrosine-type recombinase/integrase [Sphingobacterium paludis]|uniref:Phage integrase family protein n=1 Tax=Sphingobacterium paludis TaxID=1476465 RepID=A0A4V3E1V7_9SPHI|nr:site-specific integrase [Sphingobacterium paludis]TDS14828.1 phage integrase family protein [Sphingobacterium paludis]
MIVNNNEKYRFSEPKHTFEAKGNLVKVYVNYYYEGKRCVYKFAEGLNTKYFTIKKDITNREIKKRVAERLQLINSIEQKLREWIDTREFDPTNKLFKLPSNELSLLSYYNDFIEYKTREKIKASSLIQYKSKLNTFTEYLTSIKQGNISLSNADKHLFISYFQYVKANNVSDAYYNDILNYHRMVYNYIIDIKEQTIKNPLKVIKSITLNESEKHQIIESEFVNDSFMQLQNYASMELMLICKFLFYTLHRPDTLVRLQLSDFNLSNNILHIPADKIKTGKAVTIQLHPSLKEIIEQYIADNEVNEDSYLFGYEYVPSVRGQKKQYQLFASNQSHRQDYTLKFSHFRDKQIIKAYKSNPSLSRIFTPNHTLYGYKHTSIVFLRENNWTLEQIIQISGHKKTEIAQIYARQHKPKLPEFPKL